MNQIADFIIRFRQGNKKNLELKQTNVISSLLDTLEKTGYINYSLLDTKKQGMMRIEVSNNRVQGMELISKNSRDVFL
jgi:ribosomal protein S8